MTDGQIAMLVGCAVIATSLVPFSYGDSLTGGLLVFTGIVILIAGIMIHGRHTPPTA